MLDVLVEKSPNPVRAEDENQKVGKKKTSKLWCEIIEEN